MKKKDNSEIGYRIADIRTVKFVFGEIETETILPLLENGEHVNLSLGVSTDFLPEKNSVQFDVIIELTNAGESLINFIGRTIFEINGFEKLKSKKNDDYDFPQPLLEQLYGISFSHARALLTVETARTNFNGSFYLPVVDPRRFIEEKK